jgi:hypothetical protein
MLLPTWLQTIKDPRILNQRRPYPLSQFRKSSTSLLLVELLPVPRAAGDRAVENHGSDLGNGAGELSQSTVDVVDLTLLACVGQLAHQRVVV